MQAFAEEPKQKKGEQFSSTETAGFVSPAHSLESVETTLSPSSTTQSLPHDPPPPPLLHLPRKSPPPLKLPFLPYLHQTPTTTTTPVNPNTRTFSTSSQTASPDRI